MDNPRLKTAFEMSEILYKRIQERSLSPEESKKLNDWRAKNKDNRDILDTVEDPEALAGALETYRFTDSREQLAITHRCLAKRRKVRIWRLGSVAAAIVLLTLVPLYWFTSGQPEEIFHEISYLKDHDVLPGKQQATLTRTSGEEWDLDGYEDGVIAENGQLFYGSGQALGKIDPSETIRIRTPRAGQYKVTLSDGTKVWLNAASELSYPVQFTGDTREVVVSGEAYFDVTPNAQKPFIVRTDKQQIRVLGTQFTVRTYDAAERTTLLHGKVAIKNRRNSRTEELVPGLQAQVSDDGIAVSPGDLQACVGWKDGKIMGNSLLLKELLPDIARWYDIEFVYDEGYRDGEKGFVIVDRTEKLSEVLRALSDMYDVTFKIRGKEVIVSKKTI